MHTITMEITLTDEEFRIVARDVAHMIAYNNTLPPQFRSVWDAKASLRVMLARGITETGTSQQQRDSFLRRVNESQQTT